MIYCVLGPTASRKSELAELVRKTKDAVLINFDAFQIYKEMDIGTAKPSKQEIKENNYLLYDFKGIDESFDVYNYQQECRKLLEKYKEKNIVLVGGTGLYLKAALFDYKFEKEDKMPLDYKEEFNNEELFEQLKRIDIDDALKIGANNRKRLLRALYIYETHGINKTCLNDNGKNNLLYEAKFIGIDFPREYLYERINKRVDKMFSLGLCEEVQNLFKKYGSDMRALQAIGYKEFNLGLSLEDTKELIKKNTRNYAKRQLTFFRHQFQNIMWFSSFEEAKEYIENGLL